MKKALLVVLVLFTATVASAQVLNTAYHPQGDPGVDRLDPLRNVAGTVANPGTHSPWLVSGESGWSYFGGLSAHVTYVSETGPEEQHNETFSTNWFVLGARHSMGSNGFFLLRSRISLDPYTVGDDGYPQMLQLVREVSPVLVDRMRPQDLLGELAAQVGYRPSSGTLLHLYVAAAGDPALGAAPYVLRDSSREFAEAPFAYDLQESFHSATSVATAGFSTRSFQIEGSVFHRAFPSDDFTRIDDGDIDSKSARITFTPSDRVSMQFSRGELGEDIAKQTISSGSLSYGTAAVAATALWTRREHETGAPAETAYGFEIATRGGNHNWMGRAEWVDRPDGFPDLTSSPVLEQTTHFTAGYLYDFSSNRAWRGGLGVNIDYHTQSHELPERYGHKPQAIYAFMRFRTR